MLTALFACIALSCAPNALQAASAPATTQADRETSDLAGARAIFETNVRAIQERDREAYVGSYLESERLVRTGAEGFELGWQELAEGAAATGSDDWPATLLARDLQLTWLRAGLVYGTYRYRVSFDGTEWVEGLSERVFTETEAGWRIAVTTAFEATDVTPAPPVVLVGATVHTGTDAPPIANAVVVLRGGRIEAVGPPEEVQIPTGVDVVDLRGRHLIPGLIDTHVHYSQTGWVDGRPDAADVRDAYPYAEAMAANQAHPDRFHRAFLASGITAVFDVGGYPWTRRLGAATETSSLAPHVVATGPLIATFDPGLNLFDSSQMLLPTDEDEARAMVRSHAAAGSQAIKFWFVILTPNDVRTKAPLLLAVGDEAAKLGLPLVVHATELEAARVAVQAGAALLVHSIEDAPVDDAFIEACLKAGTRLCPTLTVLDGYAQVALAEVGEELLGQLPFVHPSVAERVLATESLPAPADREALRQRIEDRYGLREATMTANLMRLHEAGVRIVLGTDAGNPLTLHGPSVFPELEAMQRAGMTPAEVLIAATSGAAAALDRDADLGRIEAGFIADLVVLEADPTADIANVRTLTHVVRAGTVQTRAQVLFE